MILARKGEIVTCENGHALFRLTDDMYAGSRFRAGSFETVGTDVQKPAAGEKIKPCACGARWVKGGPGVRVHFEDGWR